MKGWWVVAGLLLAAAVAFFLSPLADPHPDGLERVAIDQGFAEQATEHPLGESPLADYGLRGVDDEGLGTGLAGVIGVVVTFLVAMGVFALARRLGRAGPAGR